MTPMARQIRWVAALLLAGFVAVALDLAYWQVVAAPSLIADAQLNAPRLMAAERSVERGRILDRQGVELARSEVTADGYRRVYPHPSAAHVLGYYSFIYGMSGIEASADGYLRGSLGLGLGAYLRERLLHQSVAGSDVRLTLDERIQEAAEAALGKSAGAIVAIDPRTGAILAMVSHPAYNPGTLEEDWATLRDDPGYPLLNRATQGLYDPGSTFKTVTLASALDLGLYQPSSQVRCASTLNVNGFDIVDNNVPRHGTYDLAYNYAWSCNTAFAQIGLGLGVDRLSDYARRFGFESTIPLEIPSEVSLVSTSPGFLSDDVALAATAMGQGELLATPLQMALVAAAIANDGVVPTPYLIDRVERQGSVVWSASPHAWRTAVRPEVAREVSEMMVGGVKDGWASSAGISGVQVAGKTGTAEVGPGKGTHAWFIGFAPADDPKIVVAVIKENAGGGATVAAPAAKAVMQSALGLAP